MSIMDKFSVVTFPWGRQIPTMDGFVRAAQHAEELGFYSIHVPMELTQGKPYDPSKKVKDVLDTLVILPVMVMATKTIRIGSDGVTLPFLPPIYWAKYFATLDVMSGGGRLVAGMCPGYGELQFAAAGMSKLINRRGSMANEQLEIITRLWAEESVTFDGKYYHLKEVCCEPKPIEKPHPPIWFAGGVKSIPRAARYAECLDAFLPTFDEIRDEYVPGLKEQTKKWGTTTELGTWLFSYITPDRELSPEEKEEHFRLGADRGKSSADLTMSGSPEQCAAKIREYQQAGITRFVLDFQRHGPDSVETGMQQWSLFVDKVVPLLE